MSKVGQIADMTMRVHDDLQTLYDSETSDDIKSVMGVHIMRS